MSLLVAATIAFACDAAYVEMTGSPYDSVVGIEFRTRRELIIHGVLAPGSEGNADADWYTVTPRPGIAGREVVSRSVLPPGTVMRIERVLLCENCLGRALFPDSAFLSLEVSLAGYPSGAIRLRGIGDHEVLNAAGESFGLSNQFFEPVLP